MYSIKLVMYMPRMIRLSEKSSSPVLETLASAFMVFRRDKLFFSKFLEILLSLV